MKTSSDILESSLFIVTPAGSRTFQGPLVMASLTAFPGNGGELHHKLAPSSGASLTDNPLSPTLLIDTPDTLLLTSQGLFASQDAFQVIGQLCISFPDGHCCTRPSTRQRDTNRPATGNKSQDQLFTADKPNPTTPQRSKSNIPDYSTKLDKFKLFLAASKLKRAAAVKRLHDSKSLLYNTKLDTRYKDIILSQRNNIKTPQSW